MLIWTTIQQPIFYSIQLFPGTDTKYSSRSIFEMGLVSLPSGSRNCACLLPCGSSRKMEWLLLDFLESGWLYLFTRIQIYPREIRLANVNLHHSTPLYTHSQRWLSYPIIISFPPSPFLPSSLQNAPNLPRLPFCLPLLLLPLFWIFAFLLLCWKQRTSKGLEW